MRGVLFLFFCFITLFCQGQTSDTNKIPKFEFGVNAGVGWANEDEACLYNSSICLSVDYRIINKYSIQFAPQYSWLWKWNEHYLTIPIHLRKKFGERFSLFAGPALSFNVGNFNDLGFSGGVYYHFCNHSALAVTVFSFTLYDYCIGYLYVPVSISYRFSF
jgi:hypothetical protein